MTVVKAQLKAGGRDVKGTFNGYYINGEGQFNISGTVTFVAYCTEKDESPVGILLSPLLPQIGALYVEGGRVFPRIVYKDGTPRFMGVEGRYYRWEVVYTLEGRASDTETVNSTDGETVEDPILLNFSLSAEKEEYASAYDLDGIPNCNSLGEFFADPIMFNDAIVNFNFSRKEFRNPIPIINAYWQAHNAAPTWGLAPGTLKVAEITTNATQKFSGTEWDVSYKIQYRRRGWAVEKANTGMYYNVGGGVMTRALNADGSPTDAPVILNLDGTKWTGGTVPCRYFRTTYPMNFDGLGLPNPFLL